MMNIHISIITKCIDESTRIKKIKIRHATEKPWVDKQLTELIKGKNYWYNKLIRDPNNNNIRDELKYWRNKVTLMKRKKKENTSMASLKKLMVIQKLHGTV